MTETNVFQLSQPGTFADPLTEVLRNGARALLAQAVEAEVAALLNCHADKLTDDGRQRLVRHGHLPEREIMTGIGPVAVRCPRVRDRVGEGAERIRFSSAILPPYARRSKSLEVLIPILYLKGVSTGDFEEALARAARQGCRWALGLDHRAAQGRLVGGARALEQARSLRQALRLLLGRRHPRAGSARGRCPVPAGHHRRHAGGQEGACRPHRRRARERAILAGTAARPEAARACDRRPNSRSPTARSASGRRSRRCGRRRAASAAGCTRPPTS